MLESCNKNRIKTGDRLALRQDRSQLIFVGSMGQCMLRTTFDAVAAQNAAVWDYLDGIFVERYCFCRTNLHAIRATPAPSVAYVYILGLLFCGHPVIAFMQPVKLPNLRLNTRLL